MNLLRRDLLALAEGRATHRPIYDFSTHTRSSESIQISPADVVIVEGLFVLYWEEIRQLLDTKVFIFLTDAESLARRLVRDVRERGRTEQSVVDQYQTTVKPMTEKYVLPTRHFADILVQGTDPVEDSAEAVIKFIPCL